MAWLHAQAGSCVAFWVGQHAAALSPAAVQQMQPLLTDTTCCPPCRGALLDTDVTFQLCTHLPCQKPNCSAEGP